MPGKKSLRKQLFSIKDENMVQKEEVLSKLRWGEYGKGRKGDVYIPRKGKKSVILVNVSYTEELRNVAELEIANAVEKPNVILLWLEKLVVRRYSSVTEDAVVTAPSGIKIETKKKLAVRELVDIVNNRVVGKEVISEEYEPVDMGYHESKLREEAEKIKKQREKLEAEVDGILKEKVSMKKTTVFIHRGCGGKLVKEMVVERTGKMHDIIYKCDKCGKTFVLRVTAMEYHDPDEGWKYHTVERFIEGDDVEEKQLIEVDEEARRKYGRLEEEQRKLEEEISRLSEKYIDLLTKASKEEAKLARKIAERLGIRIVREEEKKVVFNDGTVFYRGDITMEPHFEQVSPVFMAVKDADKIWLSLLLNTKIKKISISRA